MSWIAERAAEPFLERCARVRICAVFEKQAGKRRVARLPRMRSASDRPQLELEVELTAYSGEVILGSENPSPRSG